MSELYRPLSVTAASALTVLTITVMVPVLHFSAAVTAVICRLPYAEAFQRVSAEPIYIAGVTIIGIGIALIAGKTWGDPDAPWQRTLYVNSVRLRIIAFAIIAGLALQFPLTELSNISELVFPVRIEQKQFVHQLMSPKGWLHVLNTSFALVLIVPVCEELFFRGLILRGLRGLYGDVTALLISSLLFGLSHFRLPTAVLPATVAGVFLGTIVIRTGSIWSSIALHAAVNAVPLLVTQQWIPIQGFNSVDPRVNHIPATLLVGSSAVAILAFSLIIIATNRQADTTRPPDDLPQT
jgi:membrane protease YdiL (CAAX protease family)